MLGDVEADTKYSFSVIPAEAGIHSTKIMDSRFHGNDTHRMNPFCLSFR